MMGFTFPACIKSLTIPAAGAGRSLTVETGSEPIRGEWDRLRLEQVLSNLLSNALKYGAGKPVHVAVGRSEEVARLTVRDEGIGIAAEDAERIFGRFERAVSMREYGGLGLGLFIARQIAGAHGGEIRVQSKPNGGSEFTVLLPMIATEAPTHAPEPQH